MPASQPPTYEELLIPTDGSEPASRAADHGLSMAAAFGATVHVVSVVEELPGAVQRDRMRTDPTDVAREAVETVAERARSRGLAVETATPEGAVDQALLGYADDHAVDLIVMGTHGRTGATNLLFGSIAEGIVRNATVPVVTVRPTD